MKATPITVRDLLVEITLHAVETSFRNARRRWFVLRRAVTAENLPENRTD